MAKKQMTGYSTPLITTEIQIKITVWYHFTPPGIAAIKKETITTVDYSAEKLEHSYFVCWAWCSHCRKTFWQFLKILKIPCSRAVLFLAGYSRGMKPYLHKNTCIQMFMAVSFIIAQSQNSQNVHQLING